MPDTALFSLGQIRVSAFPAEKAEASFDLSALKDDRPYTQSFDPKLRRSTTEVTFERHVLKVTVEPGRFDFIISVPQFSPDMIFPSTALLGGLDEHTAIFDQIRALCETVPNVARCAIGTTSFAFPESEEEGFRKLAALSPIAGTPPALTSQFKDFAVTLNYPVRERRLAGLRFEMNRLLRLWGQECTQGSVTLGSGGIVSNNVREVFLQTKAETDVNNVPDGSLFNGSQMSELLAAFFVETRQLLLRGFRP